LSAIHPIIGRIARPGITHIEADREARRPGSRRDGERQRREDARPDDMPAQPEITQFNATATYIVRREGEAGRRDRRDQRDRRRGT
jgi:hypothetical protein